MKKATVIGVVAAVLAVILGVAVYMGEKSSIGVIGGADGPTAVFVAGSLGSWVVPLLVVIVLLLVVILIYRKRKH